MPYEYSENPSLTYSFSRLKILSECPQKYYLNYYHSHNGWLKEAELSKQQAYRLKCLQNIHCITGTAIHSCLKDVISVKNTYSLDQINIQRWISKEIKTIYRNSIENLEHFNNSPKKYPTLFELYYHADITDDTKEKINNIVINSSKSILDNDTVESVNEKKLEVLIADELKTYDFAGIFTIVTKIDLLARDNDNYYIVDWKTSNSYNHTHVEQLLLYTYLVSRSYNVPVDQIECRLVYLTQNNTLTFTFQEEDMNLLEERFLHDYEVMRSFIVEGTANTPLPEEKFKKTANKNTCHNCNFQEMCNNTLS